MDIISGFEVDGNKRKQPYINSGNIVPALPTARVSTGKLYFTDVVLISLIQFIF